MSASSSSSNFEIVPFSDRPFELGEGPHWDAKKNLLYFVDVVAGIAATYDSTGKIFKILYKDKYVSVVLPIENVPNRVVCTNSNTLLLVDTDNQKVIRQLDALSDIYCFNDAKADPNGQLWIGSVKPSPDFEKMKIEPAECMLQVLDEQSGKLRMQSDGIILSNGLAWSPDNRWMYFIDSIAKVIYRFYYHLSSGTVTNRTVFVDMNSPSQAKHYSNNEFPDGMTVDIKGNLWVAMFGGSRIVQIDGVTGELKQSIKLPISCITSATFGGESLNELYVTTCRTMEPKEELERKDSFAGYIFKITNPSDTTFRGVTAGVPLRNIKLFN